MSARSIATESSRQGKAGRLAGRDVASVIYRIANAGMIGIWERLERLPSRAIAVAVARLGRTRRLQNRPPTHGRLMAKLGVA